jgi:hypothetical protein
MAELPAPTDLGWDALRAAGDEVPWAALEQVADALAETPALWPPLEALYRDRLEASYDVQETYAYLYVCAIAALAAPRLPPDLRENVGRFLTAELRTAALNGDDILCDVLENAAACLGPAVLPTVLDRLEEQWGETGGGWFYLWGLVRLVAGSEDAALRQRAADLACRALRDACDGTLSASDVWMATEAVVDLRCEAARPLLRRLLQEEGRRPEAWLGYGDIAEALAFLGTDPPRRHDEWEEPVRTWFEAHWRSLRRWYERERRAAAGPAGPAPPGGSPEGAPAEETDADDRAADFEKNHEERRRRGAALAAEFAADLPPDLAHLAAAQAAFIARWFLQALNQWHFAAPEELEAETLREMLISSLPRTLPVKAEVLPDVPPLVRALLEWLHGKGAVADLGPLLRTAEGATPRFLANAADPILWCRQKRRDMAALGRGEPVRDLGFATFADVLWDMALAGAGADPLGLGADNDRIEGGDLLEGDDLLPGDDPGPGGAETILRQNQKVGRNDPCPCGSGKKYKKCCMRKT